MTIETAMTIIAVIRDETNDATTTDWIELDSDWIQLGSFTVHVLI